MASTAVLLAVALLAPIGLAAAAPTPERLVLRCGRILDGRGESRDGAVVVVEEGRVAAVLDGLERPVAGRIVDLSKHTCLPGLIDVHTHLLFRPGSSVPDQALRETSSFRALRGLAHARALLEAGFTTVRDLGTEGAGYADVALCTAIERGIFPGPRVLAATLGITMTGGDDDRRGYSPELALPELSVTADGPDAVRRAVRTQIKHGADVIKIYATAGGPFSRAAPGLSLEELEAAVEEARKQGRRVAAHAAGGEGARNAVMAGAASIEHGDELEDDTLRLMAERGTVWVPTPLILDYIIEGDEGWSPATVEQARRTRDAFSGTFRRALAAGVKIAFGTEAGGYFQGTNWRQLEIFRREGMPADLVIGSATSVAAQLLGLDGEIGVLAAGARADVVAVDGDPREDVVAFGRVVFVMKNGVVVKAPAVGGPC